MFMLTTVGGIMIVISALVFLAQNRPFSPPWYYDLVGAVVRVVNSTTDTTDSISFCAI